MEHSKTANELKLNSLPHTSKIQLAPQKISYPFDFLQRQKAKSEFKTLITICDNCLSRYFWQGTIDNIVEHSISEDRIKKSIKMI